MKKSIKFLPLLATGLLAVGCQDYDAGFTEADIKTKQYADKFVQEFGQVDPNQDWSMATLVDTKVNLPAIQGTAKMNIMTGDPRLSSTRLLAQIMLQDGQGEIQFNAIKGRNNVFVTVEQDGKYKVFGGYAVVNGFLGIGDVQMPMTRGGVGDVDEVDAFSDDCPTTLSTAANGNVSVGNISFKGPKILSIRYGNYEYTYDRWVEIIVNGEYIGDSKLFTWDQYTRVNNSPFETSSMVIYKKLQSFDEDAELTLKTSGIKKENGLIFVDYNGSGWWSEGKTLDEWKQYLKDNLSAVLSNVWVNNVPSTTPFTDESIAAACVYETVKYTTDDEMASVGAFFVGTTDPSTWELRSGSISQYEVLHPTLQYLKDVEQVPAPAWNRGLGYSLFGPGAFFQESVPYYAGPKVALYGDNDLTTMEKGFMINSTGGEITLPFIFGCTAYANQFGYIYWKDGEDPLLQPHYVLMEDARPSSNIYYGEWGNEAKKVGDEALSGWQTGIDGLDAFESAMNNKETNPEMWMAVSGQQIVGTSYRVMYFDPTTGEGTYNFPAGYHIAFFIDKLEIEGQTKDQVLAAHTGFQSGNFNYSLPELNNRIYDYDGSVYSLMLDANRHWYSGTAKGYTSSTLNSHKDDDGNIKDGAVKAISWKQGGNYYLGFGDNSGDHDLNDIVFLVQGAFTTENVVKVASIKWHMNLDGNHHNAHHENPDYEKDDDLYLQQSPKLGASYTAPDGTPVDPDGRTFLGWATSPNGAPILPADFGTKTADSENDICYFAIWEDNEEKVTITWHKNWDSNAAHDDTDEGNIHMQERVTKSTGTYSKPESDPAAPTGKQFVGWATSKDAGENDVIDPTTLVNLTSDADICYYAVYKDIDTPVVPDPQWISWIFACEDLGGTFDYDFNDVVLEFTFGFIWTDVIHTTVGIHGGNGNGGTARQEFAEIYLVAAGGTLPAEVYYDDEKLIADNGKSEIHQIFGQNQANVYSIVNATNPMGKQPVCIKRFTLEEAGDFWQHPENVLSIITDNIKIKVETNDGNSHYVTAPSVDAPYKGTDKAPQIIVLPYDWEWPTENTFINDAYPGFKNWANDATWTQWKNGYNSGLTVKHTY